MSNLRHTRNLIASILLIIAYCAATIGHPLSDASQINITLDEIKTLADNIDKETARLTNMEEPLKSELKRMKDGMDYAIEIIIHSLVSTRTDKSVGPINEVLSEVQSLRTELINMEKRLQSEIVDRMDSAIAKIMPECENVYTAIVNVPQKLQETLLIGMEAGNRTIDDVRRHHQPFEHPKNCEEIQLLGHKSSGVYRVYPFDFIQHGKDVYCDLLTAGGGWTVIQRRQESLTVQEDFERTWDEYAAGFGHLNESHWIGLDVISALTNAVDSKLRIEMTDWEDQNRTATYSNFRIANASKIYRLNVSGYYGDAGDSLKRHNGYAFSTKDRDNDVHTTSSCAQTYNGAWWFYKCYMSSLNGIYFKETNAQGPSAENGINWFSWHEDYSLKRTEMKIRSTHFQP